MKSPLPSTALLLCTLLAAPALAGHSVTHEFPSFLERCDPEYPHTCLTCNVGVIASPCSILSPGFGCVPNTVEPRHMRPSAMMDNCVPPPPDREELPEPMWGVPPTWPTGEETEPVAEAADRLWAEHVRQDLLP